MAQTGARGVWKQRTGQRTSGGDAVMVVFAPSSAENSMKNWNSCLLRQTRWRTGNGQPGHPGLRWPVLQSEPTLRVYCGPQSTVQRPSNDCISPWRSRPGDPNRSGRSDVSTRTLASKSTRTLASKSITDFNPLEFRIHSVPGAES